MGLLDAAKDFLNPLNRGPIGTAKDMLFGGSHPGYEPPALDETTQDLINKQGDRANRSDEAVFNEQMRGVDQGAQMKAAHEDMQARQRALGGIDSGPFSQAIANKARRSYDRDFNQIQRQTRAKAPLTQFEAVDAARQSQLKRVALQTDIVNMERKALGDRLEARNAMISSLASLGGTAGGAALANRGGSKSATPTYNQTNDSMSGGGNQANRSYGSSYSQRGPGGPSGEGEY